MLDFTRTPFAESDTLGALSDSPVQEWIDTTMNGFWKDIAFGVRTQLKTPAVTLALIVTLAFGLGANTVAFSLVNSFFLRPLRIQEPERLVRIYSSYAGGMKYFTLSYPDYADIAKLDSVFSGALVDAPVAVSFGFAGASERLWGERVSGDYFSLLGVKPACGRFFIPEEDWRAGVASVVVLSHGLWQRSFGGSPGVLSQRVTINGQVCKIIGVAPEAFQGVNLGFRPELWLPIIKQGSGLPSASDRGSRGYFAIARLQPGVTLAQARAALDLLAQHLQQVYPLTNRGIRFAVLPESEGRVHPMARGRFLGVSGVLMAVAVLVLLLACANIAGILLVRAGSRRTEIGVRLAMGGTRGRIIRQLLTEGATLSLPAGGVGVAFAWAVTKALSAVHLPTRFPLFFDLGLDERVLAFSLVVTVVTTFLFGLAPALEASRSDVFTVLKDGEATRWLRPSRLRKALVAAQVALSTVVLIGGGLFLRSLQNAERLDVGFDPEGVVATSVDVGLQGYKSAEAKQFWRRLVDQLSTLPGTESVSLASTVPFELNITTTSLAPEGYQPPAEGGWPSIEFAIVDSGYFKTMRIPLLQGRDFSERDSESAPPVVVVNDVLARRFWPGTSAVGKRLMPPSGGGYVVIGVVKRGKYLTLGEEPKPYIYFPLRQTEVGAMAVLVRGKGDPSTLLREVRDTVRAMDHTVPLFNVTTMASHVGTALAPARAEAAVINIVGLVALALSGLGLYGMTAHTVSRRTHEMGVRRALGAQDHDVVLLVLGQAAGLVLVGLAGGIALGFTGSRLLRSLLYGIEPTDPLVFGLVPVLLVLVCVVASWAPAYRAVRIDVAAALRYE